MEQVAGTVTPRIRPMLNTLETISYELPEAEYSFYEVHNPWVQKLLHAVETNIVWLQPAMTVNNYDSFVHLVIDFIIKILEGIMMQKMFNQLGACSWIEMQGHWLAISPIYDLKDCQRQVCSSHPIGNHLQLGFLGENVGPMTWGIGE
ncbi:Conserved oligomeric golgi complex subunit [Thalictrum thalictroides]|uniref:Conserved oligomeric golgi complex subunit n=1 Tax=Thalictrum thalictroides TaxID=46969 RepID=A0A7J6VKQ9_THATH|nr:Conserved oligomeric golgi complex subunit [Thalictrum thalictroides]